MLYNILEINILRNMEIFLFPEGWLLYYKYIASMIVEYRKTYLKKWQPLFVTPADYALPFFFLLYYMG